MEKPKWTDAEYEVVSDPRGRRIDPWQPSEPRRRFSGLQIIKGCFSALLIALALFTLAIGLSGGDIDTTTPYEPSSAEFSADNPLPIPAVDPAPTSASSVR